MSLLFGGLVYVYPVDIVTGVPQPPKPNGVYIVSDSAITSVNGSKTILGEFKKIYPVDVRLLKPDFDPSGVFTGYRRVYEERPVIVGFAGGTLTAQHILNEVRACLRALQISCLPRNHSEPISYCVCLPGDQNELMQPGHYWQNDTFADTDFAGLLTSDVIANAMTKSMNVALQSARKYKLNAEDFEGLRTEFLLGTWCPLSGYKLFMLQMEQVEENGYLMATVKRREIPGNLVGTIGLPGFEKGAELELSNSLAGRNSAKGALHAHLGACIEKTRNAGNYVIDKPIFGIMLNQHKVSYF